MHQFLVNYLPNVVELFPDMIKALWETIGMVSISGFISTLIGIPLGIILVVTRPDNILENSAIYNVVGKSINIFRAIPFVILLAAIIPFTRLVVGTTIGMKGALVPLVIGSIPFVARQMESALLDIDKGVIEASQAMRSSSFEIIYRVLLKEGLPGIVYALTITTVSLIGFSAVAGTVGGGGLGDFAIRYGYQYFKTDIMVATILILLVLVTSIQSIGEFILKKLNH
ncbi:methionine ABC transporter permease [Clostridium tagluense]|uniref:D-methionine ABC transporter permease n=1 Tax=Clostridium tagluense TaxID=360422 RepID=A0A401UU43_9CLOT|nr:methionine ABC transporter permease [Clostridium tagluense]GCD13057.1 D-methionine ABC transporter permease [Clostridium tagluense]